METITTKRTKQLDKIRYQESLENPKTKILQVLEEINHNRSISRFSNKNFTTEEMIKMGFINLEPQAYTLSSLGKKALNYWKNEIKKNNKSQIKLSVLLWIMGITYILALICALPIFYFMVKPNYLPKLTNLTNTEIFISHFETIGKLLIIAIGFCFISVIVATFYNNYKDEISNTNLITTYQLIQFFRDIHMSPKNLKCEIKIIKKYNRKIIAYKYLD